MPYSPTRFPMGRRGIATSARRFADRVGLVHSSSTESMPIEPHPRSISLTDKVDFLSRPGPYGLEDAPETEETHMSWVFLAGDRVYKLKKPVRMESLDLTTAQARRENCEIEVALNRRLSPDIYLGTVALTLAADGSLALGGCGEPVDWLVEMRRLPADRFLDHLIESDDVPMDRLNAAVGQLVAMYARADSDVMTAAEFRRHLSDDCSKVTAQLAEDRYGLATDRIRWVPNAQRDFINRSVALFQRRVDAGRVVDAHGDLRPEHLCLTDPPRIIDCLEFSRRLRIMDAADELSFLAQECELAGASEIGEQIMRFYRQNSADSPPVELTAFYQSHRAMIRAMLAVRHLDDEQPDRPDHWRTKARDYLDVAERRCRLFSDAPLG